jgi:thymidylate synthase ThyX
MEHLDYMLKTIKGAFEFIHYTFEITEVSRAFTHQLVRTRTASFQQESLRAVDARAAGYSGPRNFDYDRAAESAFQTYSDLVDSGMPIQDARGILPIATHTGILMSINLRNLSQMAEHRLCTRTQGEYQEVFKRMKAEVIAIHPWAEPLLNAHCVQHGVCCFPNYDKCPVQPFTLHYTEAKREKIKQRWSETDHHSNPVAKNGRTM